MKKDEELMRAYQDGDAGAFQEIYRRYSSSVYRFLLRRLRNEEDATDILQSSFLKFHRLRDKHRPDYALMQWLYIIARSELLDFHRKNQSRLQNENTWLELSQNPGSASLSIESDWKDLVTSLEGEARDVFVARALHEERFEEIAERLGKQVDAVRQIYSRGRKRLAAALNTEDEEENK